MPAPTVMAGVPPGLEYLSQIDQLLVNQQIELLECELSISVPAGLYLPYILVAAPLFSLPAWVFSNI
jgi:hypothetical protein